MNRTRIELTSDELKLVTDALHMYRSVGESLKRDNAKLVIDLEKIELIRRRFSDKYYALIS